LDLSLAVPSVPGSAGVPPVAPGGASVTAVTPDAATGRRAHPLSPRDGLPARHRDPDTVRVLGPTARPSVRAELAEIWARRDLLVQLAMRDIRIRYKQAVMGFAWAILMPLLIVLAGALVRIAVVTLSGGRLDATALGGVILRSFPWAFFSGALGFAVGSITGNLSLVTKIWFPRAILPIATVLANLFDFAIGAITLLLIMPFVGGTLSPALLWIVPLVLLLVTLTTGLAMLFACANLFFRDVKYLVQIALTFGIFFTPVFFDASTFGATGSAILMLNPLAPIFEGLRLAVVDGHDLLTPLTATARGATFVAWQPWYLLYSALWAVGTLVGGLSLFQRTQDRFAEFA
jgi:ABC-type polysaccharide/polyol phosphate export permease